MSTSTARSLTTDEELPFDNMKTVTGSPDQKTTGARAVLSLASAYRAAQWLIGATRSRELIADEFIRAKPGDRVLDLGCGTADILDHLPDLDYIGFDPSTQYISSALNRYAKRGTFTTELPEPSGERTISIAIGVLHHVNDEEAERLLANARQSLTDGGRFVSVDPTIVAGQHWVARFLVSRDRGQHVRSPKEVVALARLVFDQVQVTVRHDLLRAPYSHVIIEAS